MTRVANALMIGGEGTLAEYLTEEGFNITACRDSFHMLEEACRGLPDLALIDLSSNDFNALSIAEDLIRLDEATGMAVTLFNAQIDASAQAATLDRATIIGVDEIFSDTIDPDEMMTRLKALLRLVTMRRELAGRRELALSFGADASLGLAKKNGVPFMMLEVGKDAGEIGSIRTAFDEGCNFTTTPDMATAEAILSGRNFFDACLLLLDGRSSSGGISDPIQIFDLCNRIRLNSRLFNLPVVVLSPPGLIPDPVDAIREGATRLLERPCEPSLLHSVMATLARRQQERWRIRLALDDIRCPEVTDSRTGTFTFDFMRQRLNSLVEAAREREKHLTLVFFSFPDAHTIAEKFGEAAGNHLIRQLAQWISAMVRVEDMVAHYTGYDFCIALPDTPPNEALFVMNRIAGVLAYTDFALVEVYQPISISVEFGITGIEPGDSIETLIARARANLD